MSGSWYPNQPQGPPQGAFHQWGVNQWVQGGQQFVQAHQGPFGQFQMQYGGFPPQGGFPAQQQFPPSHPGFPQQQPHPSGLPQQQQQQLQALQQRQQVLQQQQQRMAREEQKKREFEMQKRRLKNINVVNPAPLDDLFGKQLAPSPAIGQATPSPASSVTSLPPSESGSGSQVDMATKEEEESKDVAPVTEVVTKEPQPVSQQEAAKSEPQPKSNAVGTFEKLMTQSLSNLDKPNNSTAKKFKPTTAMSLQKPQSQPLAKTFSQSTRARAWTADAGEFSSLFLKPQNDNEDTFGEFHSSPAPEFSQQASYGIQLPSNQTFPPPQPMQSTGGQVTYSSQQQQGQIGSQNVSIGMVNLTSAYSGPLSATSSSGPSATVRRPFPGEAISRGRSISSPSADPGSQAQNQPPPPAVFTNLNASRFPAIYTEVYKRCSLSGEPFVSTEVLFPILVSSQLSRDVLRELWTTANRTTPGRLNQTELFVLLGLIGLAQAGNPSPTLEDLKKTPQLPIPVLAALQPSLGPVPQPPLGPVRQPPLDPVSQPPPGPVSQLPLGPVLQPPLGPVSQPPLGPVPQPPLGPISQPPLGPVSQPPLGPVPQPPLGPVSQPPLGPVSQPPLGPISQPPTAQPPVHGEDEFGDFQASGTFPSALLPQSGPLPIPGPPQPSTSVRPVLPVGPDVPGISSSTPQDRYSVFHELGQTEMVPSADESQHMPISAAPSLAQDKYAVFKDLHSESVQPSIPTIDQTRPQPPLIDQTRLQPMQTQTQTSSKQDEKVPPAAAAAIILTPQFTMDTQPFANFTSQATTTEQVSVLTTSNIGDIFPTAAGSQEEGWANFTQFNTTLVSEQPQITDPVPVTTTMRSTAPSIKPQEIIDPVPVTTTMRSTAPSIKPQEIIAPVPVTTTMRSTAPNIKPQEMLIETPTTKEQPLLGLEILDKELTDKLELEIPATIGEVPKPLIPKPVKSTSDEDFGEFEAYSSPKLPKPSSLLWNPSQGGEGAFPTNRGQVSQAREFSAPEVWKACLSKCEEVLEASAAVFSSVQETNVLKEIVASEEGRNKLRGIVEVYRLAKRVYCSVKSRESNMSDTVGHVEAIQRYWKAIADILPQNIMEQLYSETTPTFEDTEESDVLSGTISKCSICLMAKRIIIPVSFAMDATREEYGLQLLFHKGQTYHVTCANFWSNVVQEELPGL